MPERGVRRDPCAQQRSHTLQRLFRRNFQHIIFIDDDLRRIPAVGVVPILVFAVVGEDGAVFTVLLQTAAAVRTASTGIHKTADSGRIAWPETLHARSDAAHQAHNFVPWHHREDRPVPLVANLVDIGVADAAI